MKKAFLDLRYRRLDVDSSREGSLKALSPSFRRDIKYCQFVVIQEALNLLEGNITTYTKGDKGDGDKPRS
jgi:hypothetical protein